MTKNQRSHIERNELKEDGKRVIIDENIRQHQRINNYSYSEV